jgi:hypothetical protein
MLLLVRNAGIGRVKSPLKEREGKKTCLPNVTLILKHTTSSSKPNQKGVKISE